MDIVAKRVAKKEGRHFGYLRFCSAKTCTAGTIPMTLHSWYHVAVSCISSFTNDPVNKHFDSLLTATKEFKSGIYFYVNGVLDYKPKDVFPTELNDIPVNLGNLWQQSVLTG
jgi:hypothetical protein